MALTTPANVRAYPQRVLPFIEFSLETMRFFLSSENRSGIINSDHRCCHYAGVVYDNCCASRICDFTIYLWGRDTYRLSVLMGPCLSHRVLAIPLVVVFINFGIFGKHLQFWR